MMPIPLEEIRARVLRQTESPFTHFHCCVCRKPYGITQRKQGLCDNPLCKAEAVKLGWWL